ncbi:hypothetical protein MY1884_009178 [Beauveria asiatica]
MSHVSGHDAVSNLLTLVVTTSPTPSAPSTGLLCGVLESFQTHCNALLQCNVIVVFDTYDCIATTPRLKKGQVTPETAERYGTYKDNVKTLFLDTFAKSPDGPTPLIETAGEAEYGSPNLTTPVPFTISSTADGHVQFIQAQDRRLGFGLGVRSALRIVQTPYVWIHQHDWRLIYDIPVAALLGAMQASTEGGDDAAPAPIQYICLPSGRRSSYATSEQVLPYPALRDVSRALTGAYAGGPGQPSVPLTPMFFWHDKPHLAATAHYLARVFSSRLAMMRGAFIEDSVGQQARNQMKDGQWRKWATWLYNPDGGMTWCLRHLHGRTWRGKEEEERRKSLAVLRGRGNKGRDGSPSASGTDVYDAHLVLIP